MTSASRHVFPKLCDLAVKCSVTGSRRFQAAYDGDRWEVLQPVVRICEFLDFRSGDADRFHDLELVRESGCLGCNLALGRFADNSGRCGCAGFRSFGFFGVVLKICTKHLYFSNNLIRCCLNKVELRSGEQMNRKTHLDRHTRDVETMGEQSASSQQPLIPRGELNFGNGERMAQVQRAVHVGEGKTSEPFRIFFLDLGGSQAFELLL